MKLRLPAENDLKQLLSIRLEVREQSNLFKKVKREKVRLVNVAVRQIPLERLTESPVPLRDVDLAVMTPSIVLEDIAVTHGAELPRSMRVLLRSIGATHPGGGALLSYLLFEPGFCQALIDLGRADATTHRAEIEALLAGTC